jgi:lipopolysaccharide/colanic/teichoic acid biosynthesis glycosyltransferase
MSKQPLRISLNMRGHPFSWGSWLGLAMAAASLLLAGTLWLFSWVLLLPGRLPGYGWLGLLVLNALLVRALERSLASLGLDRPRRYRSAFLGSAGWSCLVWFAYLAGGHPSAGWGWPLLAAGAAFLGGLFCSSLETSLWENNSPPPARLQAEVRQRHLLVIGQPERVPPAKRAFDLLLAVSGLILAAPLWLVASFLVWFEDPGPLFFIKNSVGRGGVNFRQFKFRTMVCGAEEATGPVSASEGDNRVLRIGKVLRKTALDELPQLINILAGEMSFVGPRPQRTILVAGYIQAMPEYAERHGVLPGLAGLAQVAGDYYLTPRQKLRFDRLYIRYSGLGFDLKLIFLAFLIAFWFRWQPNWNGRLPRKFLHSNRAR